MKKLTIEEALIISKNRNEKRFKHVFGTYEKAKYLANKYNVDEYKCQIAAILHDYAKYESIEFMEEIISKYLDKDLLKYDNVIYHGPVGAYLVEKELGVLDKDILNAIKYHVTGIPEMNDIAKIVYISDFIEDNRTHPGVDFCRYLSEISLDYAVVGCSERTLHFLNESKNQKIHPNSLATYKSFLEKVGEKNYDAIRNNYKGM